MFNRKLEVKMVKSNKTDAANSEPEIPFEKKTEVICNRLERVMDKAGRAALAYIVLDTVRQVMVTRAQQP